MSASQAALEPAGMPDPKAAPERIEDRLPMLQRMGAPLPATASEQQIASFINNIEALEQPLTTFMYGEYCGHVLDLARMVEIGMSVPPHVRTEFFDGAAHSHRPVSFEAAPLIQEIQGTVPRDYQHFFHDGVVRSYTEAAMGDPETVVPFASEYASQIEGYEPFNGVRVGLQRAYRDDVSGALQRAAAYPERFQPALFEELGWRVGDIQKLSLLALDDPMQWVPEASRCVFAQGVARGFVLRTEMQGAIRWPEISTQLTTHVEPLCARGTWRGLGWAVELTSAHDPAVFAQRLSWLTDPQQRAWAEEAMQSNGRPAWELDSVAPTASP